MDRTSISDMYPDVNNFRVMDIVTVRNMLDGKNREIKLNIHENIKKEKYKELQVNKAYDSIYENCIEKINEASTFNKTDLVFKVPRAWKDYNNYSINHCIYYIIDKLKKENIRCIKLGYAIFITWSHLK